VQDHQPIVLETLQRVSAIPSRLCKGPQCEPELLKAEFIKRVGLLKKKDSTTPFNFASVNPTFAKAHKTFDTSRGS